MKVLVHPTYFPSISHYAAMVQAEQVVDIVIESIVNTLSKGGEVSIAGLGIFSTKTRAARQARNPRTGEPISVPAMRVPKFRPAKALKDAVKE